MGFNNYCYKNHIVVDNNNNSDKISVNVINITHGKYKYIWDNKLRADQSGTLPDETKDKKYLEIIYCINREELFNNLPEPTKLYPPPKSFTAKQPRPMNCILILLKVINIIAADVNLGDRRSQTKIIRLIWWGANPQEVEIYKDLQYKIKLLHHIYFPGYSYRPRKYDSSENGFIVLTPTIFGGRQERNNPRKKREDKRLSNNSDNSNRCRNQGRISRNNIITNQPQEQQIDTTTSPTLSSVSSAASSYDNSSNNNYVINSNGDSSSNSYVINHVISSSTNSSTGTPKTFIQFDGSVFNLPSIAMNLFFRPP